MDYYRILGLDNNATMEEIKNAYWDLAKKYHPDFNQDKNAEYLFINIKQAYEVLSDYQKRRDYDSQMGFAQNYYSKEKSEDREVPPKEKTNNEKSSESEESKHNRERISILKKQYSKYILISIAIGVLLFALVTVFNLKPVEITAINLNHSSLDMEVYESTDLIVTIESSNASKPELIWKSSNPQAVQVSEIGRIVARDVGTAIVTVHEKETGLKAECKVNVAYRAITDYETSLGVYSGTLKQYIPHGYGTMIYHDGFEYEGAWKDGQMHGQGTLNYPDWTIYEGGFKDNLRHGRGKYISSDGKQFLFEFRDGLPVGEGVMIMPDGKTYKATYEDDYYHWQW